MFTGFGKTRISFLPSKTLKWSLYVLIANILLLPILIFLICYRKPCFPLSLGSVPFLYGISEECGGMVEEGIRYSYLRLFILLLEFQIWTRLVYLAVFYMEFILFCSIVSLWEYIVTFGSLTYKCYRRLQVKHLPFFISV